MNIVAKSWLIWLVLIITFIGALAGTLLLLLSRLSAEQTDIFLTILNQQAHFFILPLLIICGFSAFILHFFLKKHLLPLQQIVDTKALILQGSGHLPTEGDASIQKLVALIDHLASDRRQIEALISKRHQESHRELEIEKNTLAAVIDEMPESILLCNLEGTILLYNTRARDLLNHSLNGETSDGTPVVGLGRSILGFLPAEFLEFAIAELQHRNHHAGASCRFYAESHQHQPLRFQITPLRDHSRKMNGILLRINDFNRQPPENIERVTRDIIHLEDLFLAINRRWQFAKFPVIDEPAKKLWVNVDIYLLLNGFDFVYRQISGNPSQSLPELYYQRKERQLLLQLVAGKEDLQPPQIATLLKQEITIGGLNNRYTLGQVLQRSGCLLEQRPDSLVLRLDLEEMPQTIGATSAGITEERPVFYDFNLFEHSPSNNNISEIALEKLNYTVFDLETTGLDPDGGDEIISIGAVRIVNGRLLMQETFDQLVQPRCKVKESAIKVHGIFPEMLEEQPFAESVLPQFRKFAEDSVLVAHNAAFDMKFLEKQLAATGFPLRFMVLDTLLLSSIAQPHQNNHSLDAITSRFAINVIGRHTALGDALVTGAVFLKLLPLLQNAGIETLTQAQEASRKSRYAKIRY